MDRGPKPAYLHAMNKPRPPILSTPEQIAEAIDAAEEFRRTGLGITLDDLKGWSEALRTDPKAPCPPARKLS